MNKETENQKETTKCNINSVMCSLWDVDVIDFRLPSNMTFSFGSEFNDTSIEAIKKEGSVIRWVIFRVDSTWYVMQQHSIKLKWIETWTKQMNSDILEAKEYAETQMIEYYT
tara:strand:+ start:84 stop:419 length:336 start_codon:yes stop_codon:yes gene_type:complete